jgi:starch synthase
LFNHRQLEFYGQLNCLKAGIVFSDRVNTVSPTYAREIQTTYFGCGLDGVLTERRERLSGIVNGVDYRAWDPATDRNLPANYTPETIGTGKPACKDAVQRQFQLPSAPSVPLVGIVARLAEQKGIDLVLRSSELLVQQGVQLVVLGEGDPDYHLMLRALQNRHPAKVGLSLGFNEKLAHQIEAGSDLFLMPSQYEPSGLNQLYSLKYGTPPVVRATGGLADTIVDTTDATLADGTATGFRFVAYTPQALVGAVQRALAIYRDKPDTWLWLQRNGMAQDWSWDRSAAAYEELYVRLLTEKDPKFLQRTASPRTGA